MKNIDKIKLFKTSTIKEAFTKMSEGRIKIILVVDEQDKLSGTLSDGDIRRGLLKGMDLNSTIESIVFKKPMTAKMSDSTDKILKLALSKQIQQIPIIDENRKIQSIFILDDFLKPKKKTNKVVLMAGGMGARLMPLTENTPKPMLKVGNKPILHTIIKKFEECGYTNFIICVNYKSKIIQDYFGDGKNFGVKIEYILEEQRMGTAGALSLLTEKLNEPFFVMNGDLLTNLDFEKMLDFHIKNDSKATMCVREYNIKVPYGEIKLDNENIISITEKPVHKLLVNAGIYVLDPECINLIPKEFYDMPLLFKKIILNNKKTISFPLGEYWLDIGRLKDYERANSEYHSIFNDIRE